MKRVVFVNYVGRFLVVSLYLLMFLFMVAMVTVLFTA
jgi:hypothetical protein